MRLWIVLLFLLSCTQDPDGSRSVAGERSPRLGAVQLPAEPGAPDAETASASANAHADAAVAVASGQEAALSADEARVQQAAERAAPQPDPRGRWFEDWTSRVARDSNALILARFGTQRGVGLRWESDIDILEVILDRPPGIKAGDRLTIQYPAHAHSLIVQPGNLYIVEVTEGPNHEWLGVPNDDFAAVFVSDGGDVPLFGKDFSSVSITVRQTHENIGGR